MRGYIFRRIRGRIVPIKRVAEKKKGINLLKPINKKKSLRRLMDKKRLEVRDELDYAREVNEKMHSYAVNAQQPGGPFDRTFLEKTERRKHLKKVVKELEGYHDKSIGRFRKTVRRGRKLFGKKDWWWY